MDFKKDGKCPFYFGAEIECDECPYYEMCEANYVEVIDDDGVEIVKGTPIDYEEDE